MTASEIRIAKRIMTYMLDVAEQHVDMNFFMGLGFSMAIVYEESTGRSAQNKKPKELLEWAKDLPHVTFPKVEAN